MLASSQHRCASVQHQHQQCGLGRLHQVQVAAPHRGRLYCSPSQATEERTGSASTQENASSGPDLSKELSKSIRQTATTFAPRSSTAKGKNPAVKGSWLYNVFEVQAWVTMAVGGLLSFNLLYPSDEPDIARLMGMWSIWMFTIPSLRAKECTPREKDALNILFVGTPLLNVALPFLWKSFAFVWVADAILVASVYYWKGIWQEVYGLPFMMAGALDTPLPGAEAAAAEAAEAEEQGPGAE